MTPEQWQWLEQVGRQIPALFKRSQAGETRATVTIGERVINGRLVRLQLVTETVDTGRNPLDRHASACYPMSDKADD